MGAIRRTRNLLWSVPVGLQLSVIYALLLALVLSVLGWALYVNLDGFLVRNTAERLSRATQPWVAQPFLIDRMLHDRSRFGPLGDHGPVTREQLAGLLVRSLASSDASAAMLDLDGTPITSTQSLKPAALNDSLPVVDTYIPDVPQDWQDKLSSGKAAEWVVSDAQHGRDLVVLTPVTVVMGVGRPPEQFYLEQVASLEAADAVLNQLRLYLGLGILIGTFLGVVAGLALTRIVLRPLDRMVSTAEAISAGNLDRRLRLPEGRNEVARLGHAFDAMVDRLGSALEAQKRFIADASHELRTPMTSLEGLGEMLMMGADKGDTGVVQRTVRSMYNELGRLSRLVTDLLTLSKLDSTAPMRRERIDACALLDDVAEQVQPLFEARDVHLLVACSPQALMDGDPDRLKQVILNLVDNALRYTPANGEVRLLAQTDVVKGYVQVQVKDTGQGIAPGDLPHVFDRFYRGDLSRTRATGNSGLGLAIVRAIVQTHGGVIRVESELGKGACFTILLPLATPSTARPEAGPPASRLEEPVAEQSYANAGKEQDQAALSR